MSTLDALLTIVGLTYGGFLIVCFFVSNKLTEALRIDALILPNPSPASRLLNLFAGLVAFGYYGYSLLKSLHII